jgi:hypothetical protein
MLLSEHIKLRIVSCTTYICHKFKDMEFHSFHSLLPKIAEKETRFVSIPTGSNVPHGDYAFLDVHCADKTCDCRRVFINVMQMTPKDANHIATISYGWESFAFYRKWSGGMTNDMLTEFKGPCLDSYQKQSPLAPYFLDFFKNMVVTDAAYVNRLKKHYKLFKWKTGMKIPKDMPFDPLMLCPCESGAKFKFCCGRKGTTLPNF